MTPQMGLFFSAVAFVGTHFLLSHPLREPLVRRLRTGRFQLLYSVVALVTFGAMLFFYRQVGREPQLWAVSEAMWIGGAILMWGGSILFVGSFAGNPALPGAPGPKGGPRGTLAITRHPMMWGFALWAIVHLVTVATAKAIVLDGAILLLALVGSVMQDRKKAGLMGERWHEWVAQTAFVPFGRGFATPGAVALVGGTVLWLAATWLHPMPVGVWRFL